ncbi:MAG TPA: selenocysteine-specific translation elongation factor [Vicinamibacterales bacterium]|nr:selenocysteine-specific translation elongation factor [Vicinamibacterales bacterium]
MKHLVVGTAGHIDHGKSTLVHALTGIDPDRLKEEKARGITIELGFAHAAIGDSRVAFVDVPGHERFVRTMLAGVGGVDFVMLIVAADESVMPQTREHFDICRLLGVADGCVVITKVDAVDVDTRALVALEVAELIQGSFLQGRPVLEVSARTGEGLDELRSVLSAAAARVGRRPAGGAVRLPIDRVFTMRGFGTVATGTLVSGTVRLGDELALLPGPLRAKVRGIQVHGQPEAEVTAGRRAAVNLGGVELTDVSRGQTLAAPETLAVTRRADVVIDLLPSARPLRHGARVRVHHGTAEVLGRVSIAGPDAGHIAAGDTALARLRLEAPAVLTRGDRVILRAYSPPITIGAATVLDPAPTSAAIRTPAALARLTELRPADSTQALVAMVRERGLRGLSTSDAVARAGLGPSAVREVLTALERAGTISVAGDRLVSGAAMDQAGTGLMAIVKAFHALQPLSEGLPREEARARLFGSVDGAVFEAVMRRLVAARAMVDRERLALPTHRAALPGGEATVAAVETAYREGGLTPPDMAGIATRAGVEAPTAEAASAYLMRQKVLVRLDALLLHRDALDAVKRDIAALKAAAGGEVVKLDVAQIKDRYGLSRKFAIPLLEYLDRERVTRRMGDQRVVL